MLENHTIPLTDIAPALMATYGNSPTYERIYKAVLSGRIRTIRQGRAYHIDPSEIPAIAHLFRIGTPQAT